MKGGEEGRLGIDLLRQLAARRITEVLAEAAAPGADTKNLLAKAERMRRHARLTWAELSNSFRTNKGADDDTQ